MQLNEQQILKALSKVIDPDLKKDLVSLNMIQNLSVEGKTVSFDLVLTTPACPFKDSMKRACIQAIHTDVDAEAEVEVKISSNVSSRRKENEVVLPGVKNIIAVASGKGGVGKSTVAANLAVALAMSGARVGLVDADIYGPSIPLMFDVMHERPANVDIDGKPMIVPVHKHGVSLLSIGFFVDPSKALVWRGPMASGALQQLFSDADWGKLDYMVIDMPPGTGDIHLTLVQTLPVTGAVIVSTPQQVALADARKGVSMFRQESINVPVLGLVENMSYFTPGELPENKYYIFGKNGCKKLAEEMNIPFLGEIPIVQSICESGDNGVPAVLNTTSPEAKAFVQLAENVAQQLAIRNANMPATQKVEISKN